MPRGSFAPYRRILRFVEKLRAVAPRTSEVVRLRILGGLSVTEIAALLGVSERTVKSDWAFARAWLARYLEGDGTAS